MKRKNLSLSARAMTGLPLANVTPNVVEGKFNTPPSTLIQKHLQCHADNHHKVFIQMRHGTGYCGQVCNFDAGLLTMRDATIHGTKNTVTVPELIIQVLDGGQIAHIHRTEGTEIGVAK